MTQITPDHVEWAVVDRLRRMLQEPPHPLFNVTQTYALFSAVLCWVVQRMRAPINEKASHDDRAAHDLFEILSREKIADEPWRVHVVPTVRIEPVEPDSVLVPAPRNFERHTVDRFLINLRDATAHGDARNVSPFNVFGGYENLLAGFTFACAEFERNRGKTWEGTITLLESDMRRIGIQLAKVYRNALRRSDVHRADGHFRSDAASIKEKAA